MLEKLNMSLMNMPNTEYRKYFENWMKHWHKCVIVDWDYLEEKNIDQIPLVF